MSNAEFFPRRPDAHPMIYAYEENNPNYKGLLKVGYTKSDVERRVAQQYPTLRPGGVPYKIVFKESAMYCDGGCLPTTTFTGILCAAASGAWTANGSAAPWTMSVPRGWR